MRLSRETADRLPPAVQRYGYDREAQRTGIVHFGIGSFHRAHQACYTDRALDGGDRDWLIAGVSLRSPAVAEQLNPQNGLYTVTERSAAGNEIRLIGAVREVLVARGEATRIVARLAAPQTRIVGFTVTEKGYCRAPDGSLDLAVAEQEGFYPFLAEAFGRRRAAGHAGLTLLSCDNLAENGKQLARLVGDYLKARAPDLVGWFEGECRCPSTMVDRIVPATTADDLLATERRLGLRDEAAVMTEPFSQWVIEDSFAGPRPRWETVGVQLVSDVAPYEIAKLRMLNGTHSALAYLGLERGHTFVHQAVGDPKLRPLIEQLMREEAAPSFTAAPGQDLTGYADALLTRFANPALDHRLDQIAMDGSQKIPQRWLATLAAQGARGRRCPALLAALGAWIRHVQAGGATFNDPLAERLRRTVAGADVSSAVAALLKPGGPLGGHWQPDELDLRLLGDGAKIDV